MTFRRERGWGDLPLDALARIGRSLTFLGQDVGTMRAVCKRWKQGTFIIPMSLQPSSPPWHYAAFPCPVAIDCGARGKGRSVSEHELQALIHSATTPDLRQTLKALALDRCAITDALLLCLLDGLPFLEELSLKGCGFLSGEFLIEAGQSTSSPHLALKRLNMADCSINFHLPPLSTVISDGNQVPLGLFAPLAPNIEVLDLGGNPVGDEVIMRSVCELDQLQVLGLRSARFLTSQGLAFLSARCPAIHSLDLDECWNLVEDAEATWQALTNLRSLHTLILPVSPLPSNLPPLSSLYLTTNTSISNTASHLKLLLTSITNSRKLLPDIKILDCSIGPGLRVSACSPYFLGGSWVNTKHSVKGVVDDVSRKVSIWRRVDSQAPRNWTRPSPIGARFTSRELSSTVAALRRVRFESLMHLSLPSCGMPLEVGTALLQAAPGLTTLDFSQNPLWTPSNKAFSVQMAFAKVLGSLKALRCLNLSGCGLTDQGMSIVIDNPGFGRLLTSLNLAENKNLTDSTICRLLLRAATKTDPNDSAGELRSLDVYGTSISSESLLACPVGLTHLRFGGAHMTGGPNRDVLGLEHVFRRLSGLLSLEICDYGALKRAEFTTLCSVVTSLTQLSLRGCRISAGWKEGPPDMSTLRSLTHLKTLDLSRCVVSALETANGTANTQSMVSDELLGALGQLPFLSTLRVAESSNITAVGLQAITERMPSITLLDLTCCRGLFQGQHKEDKDLLYETVPKALVDRAIVCLPQGTILSEGHSCWTRSDFNE